MRWCSAEFSLISKSKQIVNPSYKSNSLGWSSAEFILIVAWLSWNCKQTKWKGQIHWMIFIQNVNKKNKNQSLKQLFGIFRYYMIKHIWFKKSGYWQYFSHHAKYVIFYKNDHQNAFNFLGNSKKCNRKGEKRKK